MYPVHIRKKTLVFIGTLFSVILSTKCDLQLSTHDITMKLNDVTHFDVTLMKTDLPRFTLNFYPQHTDIVKIVPSSIEINPANKTYRIAVEGTSAGHSEVTANITNVSTNKKIDVSDVFLRVTVYKNYSLDVFSVVIGWIYFVAWSISFYPQIYINWRRKSVIGLNFDFLTLNIIGFIMYSVFNASLYWGKEMQVQYFERYPRGVNPVQLNDVVFGVHAALATLITIAQCFMYERGDQRISTIAKGIIAVFGVIFLIGVILGATEVFLWLDFLYLCSYIKLAITLIKYVPQAYMNYKRKSTVGWSIGNILLDFTGGTLSMLQMIVISYNYDDWVSIFGDPTKFGLGLFSVTFDIFFIIQHYILYKDSRYEES